MPECMFIMFMCTYMFIYTYVGVHYIGMLYMSFVPLINIVCDISTSIYIGISSIYAKKAENKVFIYLRSDMTEIGLG